ncbi:MAG: TolC family protein [Candidatus Omnitrophota bacterium]|nr:MAG: TolC family protein [Candidatus Omnitrophota bacterium]
MGRLFLSALILLYGLVATNDTVFAGPLAPILEVKNNPFFLADIRYEITQSRTNVAIGTNKKVDFIYYTLEDPYRVVIDLIGVIFCELEKNLEIKNAPIKSISVIEDSTVTKPSGLEKYFYAVDYIIVELNEEYPFDVFSYKDGKIIMARIKAETPLDKIVKEIEETAKAEEAVPIHKEIPPTPTIIEDVEYEVNPKSSIITVVSNKDLNATIYEEYNPYRIVIAPPEGMLCELEQRLEPTDGLVKSIFISRDISQKEFKPPDEFFYPVKNIVIEPIVQLPFATHIADDGRITIVKVERGATMLEAEEKQEMVDEITQRLYKKQQELFAGMEQEEARMWAVRTARDKAKAIGQIEKIGLEELEDLMVKGEGVATLKYARDIALSYSEPAAIAEEEIKLSKMKLKENFRALFPSVKIRGSQTSGDVAATDIDFIEKIYGVEAEHPLYQGGRLRNAYQESKVNLNLASARYDRVVHELDYKVAEAYYSVVTSVMNLKLQQKLLKKAESILKMAQGRRSSGLSTDLELFNVKSQYNQVQFQLASAERDLALARFKLEQAMGLDIAEEGIDIGEVETELKFEIIDINLNKCLELAQDYHPGIIVNELLVESNEYEEKIARGKNKLKVDLTGFLGRSTSYYETEQEKWNREWNIGIKVSKPLWGGNTASYSFAKEETKKKVGMTDRQSTDVHSGEFAILDAMGVATGVQEAEVKRHKAENELLEARRQVNLEVKEAYYNYQEAIIQVKNSLEKVRFQKEAAKTAKAQAELNEALQSQVLEAEIKLADERSLYIKALSDYNFSLAKLNKAIGIQDYFSMQEDK